MRAKKKVEEPKAEAQEQPALRLEYWEPEKLNEHPSNWKKHPESQTKPLRELIDGVGWAGAALVNERTGKMLDGHARKKITRPGEKIPVLIGSWTEEQEKLILATLDPIGALAERDDAALQALIDEVSSETPEMAALLDEILAGEPSEEDEGERDPGRYSRKIEAPIYRPTGPKPPIESLMSDDKYISLVKEVNAASIPKQEKDFLLKAAARHTVFNYRNIAEYYAHSGPECQALMERSGLVIIDFGKAIENGFVTLNEKLLALQNTDEA